MKGIQAALWRWRLFKAAGESGDRRNNWGGDGGRGWSEQRRADRREAGLS